MASELPPRGAAGKTTAFPAWVTALVRLRSVLVDPIVISRTGPKPRDNLGNFPVEHAYETEVTAGFDDRHLDFRVSILSGTVASLCPHGFADITFAGVCI
ncbi:DUF2867 domain-containing protein [Ruegeria arenilitoris]|uniref:DUF2867 domain-containing protein n=1 Tax=Ruegeria arenilitoris TaxID=1173585 RepID=UPI003464A02C